MVSYGGVSTEDKRVLNDLVLFDMTESYWISGTIHQHSSSNRNPTALDSPSRYDIGAKAEHTLTTVFKAGEVPEKYRWSM